ncbi:hypothetical protein BC833DRAFT_547514 [Globomyces pollinis-pini]|nr:hypothetical protein BC833DRAFT_547514 [Globomyces pollinis-pini]
MSYSRTGSGSSTTSLLRKASFYGSEDRVIIEIGTLLTKLGYSGELNPRHILKTPDLSTLDSIYQFIKFIHQILIVNDERTRKVIFVESVHLNLIDKRNWLDALLLKFNFNSVSFIPSCNLALMVFAQPNGLIIDIGFNETIVIPVFDNRPLYNYYTSVPNAGKHITQRLKTLLIHAKIVTDITDSGISTTTEFLDTLSDWDIEKIKVQIALAALTVPNIQPDSSHYTLIKDVYFRINSKSMLKIPGWIREACVETLFEKTIEDISIQSAILNCLVKCPIDIRNEMVQNSVLIGGSSMIPGLGPRLQYQLMSDSDKIPKYQILNRLSPRIKFLKSIFQPNLICYVGASLLGSAKLSVHGEVKAANYTEQSIIPDWTINVDAVEQ